MNRDPAESSQAADRWRIGAAHFGEPGSLAAA